MSVVKKTKLPVVFKRKWVKALKSGQFKQCSGALASENGYDALGVACIVAGDKPKGHIITAKKHPNVPKQLYDTSVGSIHDKISKFNDKGLSFSWIAAYIDRYL